MNGSLLTNYPIILRERSTPLRGQKAADSRCPVLDPVCRSSARLHSSNVMALVERVTSSRTSCLSGSRRSIGTSSLRDPSPSKLSPGVTQLESAAVPSASNTLRTDLSRVIHHLINIVLFVFLVYLTPVTLFSLVFSFRCTTKEHSEIY